MTQTDPKRQPGGMHMPELATNPIALWQQLMATAQVVQGMMQGQPTSRLLPQVSPRLRPGVQALTFAALRHWGEAMALMRLLARKPPAPPTQALLGTALALLCQPEPLYAAHTLVNQAVQAAKQHPTTRAQAAFINGCLRRCLREWATLRRAIAADEVAQHNHPLWWIRRLQQDHPQHWAEILSASHQAARLALRPRRPGVSESNPDTAPVSIHDLAIKIGAFATPTWADHQALVLRQARPVEQLDGFAQGLLTVQDPGAQIAAPLLLGNWPGDTAPRRVLDACAAPGGKTAHLLDVLRDMPGGAAAHVLALDTDPLRCERTVQTLDRLGLNDPDRVTVRAADAADVQSWWDGQAYDAILLDAPCTASGIVRRHPDVRWLRREGDVVQLAQQQRRLLTALWPLLRPGGRLLYATCSVFKAEGHDQIEAFLRHHTDARILPSPGHLRPSSSAEAPDVRDNAPREHDGFYYALLEKS